MTDLTTTSVPTRLPNSGIPTNIYLVREPQSAFGWTRLKTIHVPAGWYTRSGFGGEVLIRVEEQVGKIDGWWGLHGENVNVRVTIK